MIQKNMLLFCLLVGCYVNAQPKPTSKAEMDSTTKLFFEDSRLESQSREIIQSPELDSLIKKYRKAAAKKTTDKSSDGYDFFHGVQLSDADFNQLSPKEKFAYAFNYPEQYRQICSMYFFDRYNAPFLHAHLPFATEGLAMSERQLKGLKSSRPIMVGYLNEVVKRATLVGNVFKNAIVELDAFECIPNLMLQYKTNKVKDNYILTACILLMEKDSFPPFLQSDIYSQLYKRKYNWREKIDLTDTVRVAATDLIDKYYQWKSHQ